MPLTASSPGRLGSSGWVSPHYGCELGAGLIGHHWDPEKGAVYDRPEKVIDACEASLRRLGMEYIDVYFCHIWWENDAETEAFIAAFDRLKRVPGQSELVSVDGETEAGYRDDDGSLHAVSPACTHMGCLLHWNDAERTWDCPCHGSRFTFDGAVIEGPATANLEPKASYTARTP